MAIYGCFGASCVCIQMVSLPIWCIPLGLCRSRTKLPHWDVKQLAPLSAISDYRAVSQPDKTVLVTTPPFGTHPPPAFGKDSDGTKRWLRLQYLVSLPNHKLEPTPCGVGDVKSQTSDLVTIMAVYKSMIALLRNAGRLHCIMLHVLMVETSVWVLLRIIKHSNTKATFFTNSEICKMPQPIWYGLLLLRWMKVLKWWFHLAGIACGKIKKKTGNNLFATCSFDFLQEDLPSKFNIKNSWPQFFLIGGPYTVL